MFIAAVLFLERGPLAVVVGAVMAGAAREWAALTGLRTSAAIAYAAGCTVLFGVIAAWSWPVAASAPSIIAVLIGALAFWGAVVPLWLARGMQRRPPVLLAAAGLVVLVPAALALLALQPGPLLAILGLVWISDTAAYVIGRAFGRRKLAPRVSPGKTVEGAAGAILASLAYAVILAVSMPAIGAHVKGFAWMPYAAGATVLCLAGILGDLFESGAKRQAGVKDSGKLLPGHGGILDRIDSACAALPVGALLVAWAGTI